MEIHVVPGGLSESLLKECKSQHLDVCLSDIGVLPVGECLQQYIELIPWQKGGAETYYAVSEILTNERKIKFIAKALVSMALTPGDQLKSWNTRRKIIESIGIRTPKLFSSGEGIFYEEFIDFDLRSEHIQSIEVLQQLVYVAAMLDDAGFTTLSFLNDIRLKNGKVYYIDFGFDLGSPDASRRGIPTALNCLLKQIIDSKDVALVEALYSSYSLTR